MSTWESRQKKELSKEHEQFIAKRYDGKRSASSGASVVNKGDVELEEFLVECKGKFGERIGAKPVRSTLVNQMEKVADEAWQAGKEPMVALRFLLPESPLADNNGYVDLVVLRAVDYEV